MLRLFFLLLVTCLMTANAQTPPPSMTRFTEIAKQCQSISCVRDNLNAVDAQMVALLGQRFAYVERAVQLQPPTSPAMSGRPQINETLNQIGAMAEQIGYSGVAARIVFASILTQSNIYERKNNFESGLYRMNRVNR